MILRSRLAALVELQPRESIAADLSSDGSSVNPNPIPTDPAALASPGSGSASAGAPVQAASQVRSKFMCDGACQGRGDCALIACILDMHQAPSKHSPVP